MLSMKPIAEPDVLALLNNDRFEGDVEGYLMMDGPGYIGHALFCVAGNTTTVLDSDVKEEVNLDGIIRACVAAGENRGATHFAVREDHPALARWWQVFCKGQEVPAPVSDLFKSC